MSINGIINVNKPKGITSFSVVARIKRLSGEKHVGHTGTLDPLATGVLPVCLGQATRIVQYIINSDKTYLAEITLGITTDTYDEEGAITERKDHSSISKEHIEQALALFQGAIDQSPPKYSALKYKGKRYYELARAGKPLTPKPRKVRINNIDLIDFNPPLLTIKVECEKGTYIRSLAHDIGQNLGCGAHLRHLTRMRCGPFSIEESFSLLEVEESFKQGTSNKLLHSIDSPILNWPAAIVDAETELAIKNGRPVSIKEQKLKSEEYCRAYNLNGSFIAILRFVSENNVWHPEKVFSLEPAIPTICPHCCIDK